MENGLPLYYSIIMEYRLRKMEFLLKKMCILIEGIGYLIGDICYKFCNSYVHT